MGRAAAEVVPRRGKGTRYVRFSHATEDYGVFSYADEARRRLSDAERDELDAIIAWFSDHLEEPMCFVPVRPAPRRGPAREPEPSAVCWFHASAVEHVARARRIAVLVRRARIHIVERRSDRVPGQICSEDGVQMTTASFWGD
jgi:hypothetical protein